MLDFIAAIVGSVFGGIIAVTVCIINNKSQGKREAAAREADLKAQLEEAQLAKESEQTKMLLDVLQSQSKKQEESQATFNNALQSRMDLLEYKLTALTDEVREHNNFARRMPVVEEQIKVINHRLDDLENEKRPSK